MSLRAYLTSNPSRISSETTLTRRCLKIWVHANTCRWWSSTSDSNSLSRRMLLSIHVDLPWLWSRERMIAASDGRLAYINSFSSVFNQSSGSASWLLILCELFLPRRLIKMRRIKGFRPNLRAIHCHNCVIQIHKRWKRDVRHGDRYRWHVWRLKGEIHIRGRNRGKERTFLTFD